MGANRSRVCQAMYDIGIAFRRDHTDIVRRLLVDQRLGDQRRTGACVLLSRGLQAGPPADQIPSMTRIQHPPMIQHPLICALS